MKTKHLLFSVATGGILLLGANSVKAQETVVVEDITITQVPQCKDYQASSWRANWYIQAGAGMQVPFVENELISGDAKRHITLSMNFGVGRWMTPYLGWRLSALGGAIHWDNNNFSKAKYANLNFDLMWDMFNSISGTNTKRIFSIVPFVGLGGAYTWDINSQGSNINSKNGIKTNSWTLPVSAGLQFRFRLCNFADFFVEGRAQGYADNFNGAAYGSPVDLNLSAIGGFIIHFGATHFDTVNPCAYLGYINQLNNQVNALRGNLATTNAALAAAEAQLPCPQVKEVKCPEVAIAPMLSAVRFTLNSSKISKEEMVNIYNVAEWMKATPNVKLVVNGYADKDTGTPEYNEVLATERAQNVKDALIGYGVDASRLSILSHGSEVQPYTNENNWNRIVLFTTE